MEEEIKKDPRDLNGDGKVTLEEKLKYAASKAGEKISETAAEIKTGAKKLYDKAAPKAKELYAEAKAKGEDLAEKAKNKFESHKEKSEEVQPEDKPAEA
ncbi:MAG: hypothetical protein J5533_04960 [Bacteroidales bacterium]|nr:hypothetical protein [Bacteroidales bacterium]